ncbi:hypothetical protein [Cohnella lupini]|nr:hypothetical protein [Cohnella lupini]
MAAYCKFETALDILVGKWKPVIQAMNDWGVGHIAHLNELYGDDRSEND